MDTSRLKKFAQHARRVLLDQVGTQLDRVLQPGSLAQRESEAAVKDLKEQINSSSREQVIEQVAYTWFNRFCALRFMDVNRYTRIGTVSPAEGFSQPEILAEAKQGHIDEDLPVDRQEVFELLDGTRKSDDPQQEAYRLLLVAVCNQYHDLMPFMFEEIKDYTELLLPEDLLSEHSILADFRDTLTVESCEDVEVIGWLYQFYISEKKDDVFAALKKGKKITPENIPAATQLFTPHWIVRYLVENSLGRLWMLNHPDSRLIEQMDYYINPEELETDFLRISSPEEIKICDPACGSGHMLTYAFDLLYAIYEEQGYQATDIPRLILTHNLYGIEIDQRAGALAAFALTMKAREKYRRFLTGGKVVQPNICVLENISIDPEDLSAYMDKVGRDLFSGGLQGVVNQWEEADNFGSLIRPLVTDVSEVLELLRERRMGEDLFLAGVHQKVLTALRQADYLSPKYHVVVANPPYMGNSGFNDRMRQFAGDRFENAKADLYAAFMVRNLELSVPNGFVAMITIPNWMFLGSFMPVRELLLSEKRISSLVHNGRGVWGSDFGSCSFVLENSNSDLDGTFLRLFKKPGEVQSNSELSAAFLDQSNFRRYRASRRDLRMIPGFPIAYWVPLEVREVFGRLPSLADAITITGGMTTADNDRFVRYWHEVSGDNLLLQCESRDDAIKSGIKWFPYNKGGTYRKWYGNREHVVNWKNDGEEIQSTGRAYPRSKEYYFHESLTYTATSSVYFGIRYCPTGAIFDAKGSSCFSSHTSLMRALGFLASDLASYLLSAINPTIEFQTGNLSVLPFAEDISNEDSVAALIRISREDWDASELSWDFQSPHVLASRQQGDLRHEYEALRELQRRAVTTTSELERSNLHALLEAYGLTGLHFESKLAGITLSYNPDYRYGSDKSESDLEALLLADTMREFVSYAVGCMLGRYSLDRPGLILANQGETADDYRQQIPEPTFAPDEDNVIPLLDGDWFTDDISERFKEFLKVTFGTEHYEENLTFLENALYPENATARKRKTIRDYFLKEFYNHHIKLYKRRPIYWMFSSPKGTFNALIYMHRYRPDTVSVVLNDYLREFQKKLRAEIEHLENVADSESVAQTEKTKALKQLTQYRKDLKELEEYEQKILYPLAVERIEIDLDDGVKVNYNKFGKALKKVTGLTGK